MPIINEQTGRALLRERFSAAGLNIQEDFPFCEGGVSFSIDGYDPAARIGYEYITTAAGDRRELTPELLAALESRMRQGVPTTQGGLYIFLIDEHQVKDEQELRSAAAQFLVRVQPLRGSRG